MDHRPKRRRRHADADAIDVGKAAIQKSPLHGAVVVVTTSSVTFDRIKALVAAGHVRVSLHAYSRLRKHGISADELLHSVTSATAIEDYPTYQAGPAVLVLSCGTDGAPLHAVWGLEAGTTEPAG